MNKHKISNTLFFIFITIFVLAVLVLIGVLSEVFVNKNDMKSDMTASKLYTLSDKTVSLLKNMEGDVDIYIVSQKPLAREHYHYRVLLETLSHYVTLSDGAVLFDYAEPGKQSKGSKFFALKELIENEILVCTPVKTERLYLSDLFKFEKNKRGRIIPTHIDAENILSGAISSVLESNSPQNETKKKKEPTKNITEAKLLAYPKLDLDTAQTSVLAVILSGILPFLVLLTGLFVYLKRKKL